MSAPVIRRNQPLTDAQSAVLHRLVDQHHESRRAAVAILSAAFDQVEALDWPLGSPLTDFDTVDGMLTALARLIPHGTPARIYNAARNAALAAEPEQAAA